MTIDRSEALEVADWVLENISEKSQFTHAQALLTLAAEVRRLRERERVLVDFMEEEADDLATAGFTGDAERFRKALEAVKE